jgi:predicted DNA-binding protein
MNAKGKRATGYALPEDAVQRLRMHAAGTGRSQSEILADLIRKHLPEYQEKRAGKKAGM